MLLTLKKDFIFAAIIFCFCIFRFSFLEFIFTIVDGHIIYSGHKKLYIAYMYLFICYFMPYLSNPFLRSSLIQTIIISDAQFNLYRTPPKPFSLWISFSKGNYFIGRFYNAYTLPPPPPFTSIMLDVCY